MVSAPAVSPLLTLLLLATAPAQVRLVYDASDTTCSAKERLMSAVMARLGYEPFSEQADDTVEVQLRRSGSSLNAQVIRSDAEGETGRRELSSPTTDCSELFRAIELAVAIAIDPRAGLVRPAVPAPRPVATPTPPPLPTPSPLPQPIRRPPVVLPRESKPPIPTFFHIGLGPTGSVGTAPAPTLGFTLLAGFQRGLFELNLGGRVEIPSSLMLAPGVIRTQVVVGSLNVCLAVSVFRACGLGELGGLRVTSTDLTPPAQQTAVFAALGGRFGVHIQLFKHFALRPFLDVAASLARTMVFADRRAVWVTSPIMGSLGVALLVTSER